MEGKGNSASATAHAAAPAPRALRILIAEDEPAHARLLSLALKKGGYHSDHVGDGAALLRAAAERPYDVIVADLHLPRLGGLEAAACLRRNRTAPEGGHPVLIAVTCDGGPQHEARSREAGFAAHFAKPLDASAFLAEIDAVARRRGGSPPPTT